MVIGGSRIVLGNIMHGRRPTFRSPSRNPVIWRSYDFTLSGYSGEMLVTAGKKLNNNYYEWLAVGFQSHELVLPELEVSEGAHTIHRKVALPPPEELNTLHAVAPHQILHTLDQAVENK
jgi:hypothetical protein